MNGFGGDKERGSFLLMEYRKKSRLRFGSQHKKFFMETIDEADEEEEAKNEIFGEVQKLNKYAKQYEVDITPKKIDDWRAKKEQERKILAQEREADRAANLAGYAVEFDEYGRRPCFLPPLENFDISKRVTAIIYGRVGEVKYIPTSLQNTPVRQREPHKPYRPGVRELTEEEKEQRAEEMKYAYEDKVLGICFDRQGNKESIWTEEEKYMYEENVSNWIMSCNPQYY